MKRDQLFFIIDAKGRRVDMRYVDFRLTPAERIELAPKLADVRAYAGGLLKDASDGCIGDLANSLGLSLFADENWVEEMKAAIDRDEIERLQDPPRWMEPLEWIGQVYAEDVIPDLTDEVARYLDYERIGADVDIDLIFLVDEGDDGRWHVYRVG